MSYQRSAVSYQPRLRNLSECHVSKTPQGRLGPLVRESFLALTDAAIPYRGMMQMLGRLVVPAGTDS